jgi:hypothetical protein
VMRAKPDQLTDGSPERRGQGDRARSAVAVVVAVSVFAAIVVGGVWLFRPGDVAAPSSATQTPASTPTTDISSQAPSASAPGAVTTPTASFGGDSGAEAESKPPVAASHAATRFADAWKLRADPAKRRTALEPVASPYLVKSLFQVPAAKFPRGRQHGHPRLLSGSAVVGEYLIEFTTGEAIKVTVSLVGDTWRATRVDPAESVDPTVEPTSTGGPTPAEPEPSN